ncbi:MAG: S-layer homology domain-containing protein, partial [Peptostreptococcaceae bacterium]
LITSLMLTSIALSTLPFEVSANSSYKDLTSSHWAYDQIIEYTNRGILNGYQDGTFKPNQNITRAEFMKVMVQTFEITTFGERYLKDNANHLNPSNMTDTWGHWANVDIRNGASHGIYDYILDKSLNANSLFRPDDFITREEASTMIATYLEVKDNDLNRIPYMYDNDKIVYWAKSSMEGLIEKDILHGYEDRTLRPQGLLTRAEAVKLVSKAEDVKSDSNSSTNGSVSTGKLNGNSTQAEFHEHTVNSGFVFAANGLWYFVEGGGIQDGYARYYEESLRPGYALVEYGATLNIEGKSEYVDAFKNFMSAYFTDKEVQQVYNIYLKSFDGQQYAEVGDKLITAGGGMMCVYLKK